MSRLEFHPGSIPYRYHQRLLAEQSTMVGTLERFLFRRYRQSFRWALPPFIHGGFGGMHALGREAVNFWRASCIPLQQSYEIIYENVAEQWVQNAPSREYSAPGISNKSLHPRISRSDVVLSRQTFTRQKTTQIRKYYFLKPQFVCT